MTPRSFRGSSSGRTTTSSSPTAASDEASAVRTGSPRGSGHLQPWPPQPVTVADASCYYARCSRADLPSCLILE